MACCQSPEFDFPQWVHVALMMQNDIHQNFHMTYSSWFVCDKTDKNTNKQTKAKRQQCVIFVLVWTK